MHISSTPRSVSEIWQDDRFGRSEEANKLLAYIESVAERRFSRNDKKSFTIAIEGSYGQGKSFFLSRLAEQIAINHPVALVDAWSDDLADQPLAALIATLESALSPHLAKPEVSKKLNVFREKASKVAKIASLGLLRRGLGLLITAQAVDAAGEILVDASDDVSDAINEGLQSLGQGLADDINPALVNTTDCTLFRQVSEFREGKKAISSMKESLSDLVNTLSQHENPNIFILIDELDGCRPTYSIKLLEEIKHLFDVKGLVFILAMNSDQLAHSVCHAYGNGFAGRAYLKRFIDREYRLADAELKPLIAELWNKAGLQDSRFKSFPVSRPEFSGSHSEKPCNLLALYMRLYDLTARDCFAIIDMLQTVQAISSQLLWAPYLFPLIIGRYLGVPNAALPEPKNKIDYVYIIRRPGTPDSVAQIFHQVAFEFANASVLDDASLEKRREASMIEHVVWSQRDFDSIDQRLDSIEQYPKLIESVARFSNPSIADDVSPANPAQ